MNWWNGIPCKAKDGHQRWTQRHAWGDTRPSEALTSIPSAFAMAQPHMALPGSHWPILVSLVITQTFHSLLGTSTTSAWMSYFWQFGKGRNWDHPYLLLKTTFLSWFETWIQINLPLPARLGTTLEPGSFFLGTDGNTVSTLVVLNSNTQQQHTDYKPWESSVSSQRTVNSNIYPQVHRHICIQATYKQQQSELHLQLDTSVVSIMCDDQDLQVPKLLHPGHPNLLCYNVWGERTFQLFSHHYMKA